MKSFYTLLILWDLTLSASCLCGAGIAPSPRFDGVMGGAIAGLPVSSKIKLLLGLRQALVEGGDGIDGVLVDLDEERMRDVHAWLESGGKLGEIDECVVALRRQAAAEAAARREQTAPRPAVRDVLAKGVQKAKRGAQKLSDEAIRVISASAANPSDEIIFSAPPKGVLGLNDEPDGVLAERLEELEEDMGRAVKEMRFEDAAVIRDEITRLRCIPAIKKREGSDGRFDWEDGRSISGLVDGFDWDRGGEDAGFEWVDAKRRDDEAGGSTTGTGQRMVEKARAARRGGGKPPWTPPANLLPQSGFDKVMQSGRRTDAKDTEIESKLRSAVAAMQLAGNGALPVGESVAKVDAALARMEKKGGETVESSLRLVRSILALILENASDPKFRSVNAGSKAFAEATGGEIGLASESIQLLEACGFAPDGESRDGGAEVGQHLRMSLDYPPFIIREVKGCVEVALDRATGVPLWEDESNDYGDDTSCPTEVNMFVVDRRACLIPPPTGDGDSSILPAIPQVDEETYVLTPHDLMKMFESNRREIERCEMLSTRAQRHEWQVQNGSDAIRSECILRFRLSDGSFIQATFHPRERVCALFSFLVSSSVPGLPLPLLKTPPPVRQLSETDSSTLLLSGIVKSGLINVAWSDGQKRGREVVAPWLREMA